MFDKDKYWWNIVCTTLVKYYKQVKKGEISESKGIPIIGKMLNCMFNNIQTIPNQQNILQMKNEWRRGDSHVIKMIGDKVDQIDAVFRYWVHHKLSHSSAHENPANESSYNYQRSSANYTYTNTNVPDMDIESIISNCHVNKNKDWYDIACNSLVKYYKKVKKGEISESNGIPIIGKMLNCMFNNLKTIPNEHNITQMKNEWKRANSNVIRMIGAKIDQIDAVFRYWVQHNHKTYSYQSSDQSYSSSSGNEQSYSSNETENLPEWGNSYNGIASHCILENNRDAKWYAIAYHNLHIYHQKLMNNIRKEAMITFMGLLFNCMVNFTYKSPSQYEINDINNKLTNRHSDFKSKSKLDDAKLKHMIVMFKDWYKKKNSNNDYSQSNHDYSGRSNRSQSNQGYYNGRSNSSQSNHGVSSHCAQTNRDVRWYRDGWDLIVQIYKNIHANIIPTTTGYAAIGHMLNCLVNNIDADPIYVAIII